ncbi:hypothetical protein F5Y17DRAFT_156494 [Xylariaceae sp. FL0594]|nr:hypothetical protein F5Y17DRAFT_156494 [Xylariaceae sp. FL0594]
MLREKFNTSKDGAPQQGSIALAPKPPVNEFCASSIVVASKPGPQAPVKQIGLQTDLPKIQGKTQIEKAFRGHANSDLSPLKSPLPFLTPEGKKTGQPSSEKSSTDEVSRLLKDALALIRQAVEIQPNLNTLVREVEKAQKAPSAYKPAERPESYEDALLKGMKRDPKALITTSQNTLILKVENLEIFDPLQVRDKINKSLGTSKVAAIRKSIKGNLVLKTTPSTNVRDIQTALTQVEKAIGARILSAEEPKGLSPTAVGQ